MEQRYTVPSVTEIFNEFAKIERWQACVRGFVDARANLGLVSRDIASEIAGVEFIDPRKVREREHLTGHDVLAFLQLYSEQLPSREARAALHYGLTSSDLVENSHHKALHEVTVRFLELGHELLQVLEAHARHEWPMLGRTHGQIAEPTTWGYKMHVYESMVRRAVGALARTRSHLQVRKVPGAVGTRSLYDGHRFGWEVPSTQVIPRDIQAEWAMSCIQMVNACEAIALEIRLLSRSEVDEVREGGASTSSAMPHKQNPVLSEKICGLARIARGYLYPLMETVALHHERDISNSSVERVIIPDLSHLTAYIMHATKTLLDHLEIRTEQMEENLDKAGYQPYASLWMSMLQAQGIEYVEAHTLVEQAFRANVDPLLRLLNLMHERNYDTISFNDRLGERMDPKWMTRNIRP